MDRRHLNTLLIEWIRSRARFLFIVHGRRLVLFDRFLAPHGLSDELLPLLIIQLAHLGLDDLCGVTLGTCTPVLRSGKVRLWILLLLWEQFLQCEAIDEEFLRPL